MPTFIGLAAALFSGLLFLCEPARAQAAHSADGTQTMRAASTTGQIAVDGRLDEEAWEQAETADEFLQFEPREGAPVSQPTEVRILYGPSSLFVGAVMYDSEPDRIQQTLGRRDEYMQADWFAIAIDSHLDRRTAFLFAVNAAGVEYDALKSEGAREVRGPGGGGDASWDAIWDSSVRVTPHGWVAEIEIPYSMLRFSPAEVQTWGVHLSREIPRLGEVSEWPLVPRTERANLIASFGILEGIRGIEPRRNVQVTPYTLSRLSRDEDPTDPGAALNDAGMDVGADLRVGLGSNVTLNATVNPDFGQVESDPAELNLTAFETFFPERRPFFVEGAQIFQFPLVSFGNLLYTRRIGAYNPVLGAAKLSGRTESGLSFGVLGAATGSNFQGGDIRQYGAARATQQFNRFSSVGAMLTAFDGSHVDAGRVLAGGADWDLRFANNTYSFRGFGAFARGDALETGITAQVAVGRRQGAWTYELAADITDEKFDPNDAGRQRYNDAKGAVLRWGHDLRGGQAFGPFQRAQVGGYTFHQWSYDESINLGGRFAINSRWTLRSFETVALGLVLDNHFGGYDLFETRGLGPNAVPVVYGGEVSYRTDDRREWHLQPQADVSFESTGGSVWTGALQGNWNVRSRLSLAAEAALELGMGTVEWAANERFRRDAGGWSIRESGGVDPAFIAFDDRGVLDGMLSAFEPLDGVYHVPVFGARDTRTIDLTLRTNYTFTPDLALQFYSQFFVARARYDDYRILTDPDTYAPFDAFPKRYEFSRSSFQFNAVLRWEYRPGSELFVVWTQNRRADDALNPLGPWTASPYDRAFGDQVSDTFGIFPGNVFMLKLSYAFLY